jgi:triosephosphate isomerase
MIAANWKLHKTVAEALAFVDEFLPMVEGSTDTVETVIAPVYTALHAVGQRLKGTDVALASQNVYFEESGAFTGEVSPGLLLDVGCSYAIVGHSERRQFFGETDAMLNRKATAAIKAGLNVIFCIGESLAQRESGKTNEHLAGQLTEGLIGLSPANLVIAYEPIWAIGTGVTASPGQAEDAHEFIRRHLKGIFGDAASEMRILYGGSVKPDNVKVLMSQPDVDGALVGGAALKAESFAALVNFGK